VQALTPLSSLAGSLSDFLVVSSASAPVDASVGWSTGSPAGVVGNPGNLPPDQVNF
jgi:hypothetical protein